MVNIAMIPQVQSILDHRFDQDRVSRSTNAQGSPSPLTFLPIEVWVKIFLLCLPSRETLDEPFDNPRTFEPAAPLLLCQICRSWRRLATSLPDLWCFLRVVVSLGRAHPAPHTVNMWLKNSGRLLLYLSIYQVNNSYSNGYETYKVLELFIMHVARWKEIQFDLAGPPPRCLLPIIKNKTLPLEKFHLNTTGNESVVKTQGLFEIFLHHVPKLTELVVCTIPQDLWREEHGMIPWAQLTSLCVDNVPSVAVTLLMLDKCRNLRHLKVLIPFGENSTLLTSQITNMALHTLNIRAKCDDITAFAQTVVLPALASLQIDTSWQPGSAAYRWPQTALSTLLERSGAYLHKLRISHWRITEGDLLALLDHPAVQSLVELSVIDESPLGHEPFLGKLALKRLTIGDDDSESRAAPLPALEVLEFSGAGALWAVDENTLMYMIMSRRCRYTQLNLRLRSFKMRGCPERWRFSLLRPLEAGGLELDLQSVDVCF